MNVRGVLSLLLLGVFGLGAGVFPGKEEEYRPLYAYSGSYRTVSGFYATALEWDPRTLAYAEHFSLVEPGGLEEVAALKKRGKLRRYRHVVAYEWLAGFYHRSGEGFGNNRFLHWVWTHRKKTLLNASVDVHPMGGEDYYYDLCNPELRSRRVSELSRRVRELGIDGLFFDWADAGYLAEDPRFRKLYRVFRTRHPGMGIREFVGCAGEFYRDLRRKGVLIVTNQAYRHPRLLRHVDYDMTESYLCTNRRSGKKIRLDGRMTRKPRTVYVGFKEIFDYFRLLKEYRARYEKTGFRNFIYMNYAAPRLIPWNGGYRSAPDRESIYFVYAMSRLAGFIPYTEIPWKRTLEETPLYFADLGEALGPPVESDPFFYREFENGIVIVARGLRRDRYLKLDGIAANRLYDLKEHLWFDSSGGETTIRMNARYDPETGHYLPSAKVFIYGNE